MNVPFFFAGFTSEQDEPVVKEAPLVRPAAKRSLEDIFFDAIKATVEAFDGR